MKVCAACIVVLTIAINMVSCQDVVDSTMDGTDDYDSYGGYGFNCLADEFQCVSDDICIPNYQRCDGNIGDCPDDSDEANCTEATTADIPTTTEDYPDIPCSDAEFSCGDSICINMMLLCDGNDDCPDASDEAGCTTTSPDYEGCESEEFECRDGVCIGLHAVCDGHDDCNDGVDEADCQKPTTAATVTFPDYEECISNEFNCGDGACIPADARCDNFDDCSDGSDERNCPQSVTTTTARPSVTSPANDKQCLYELQYYQAGSQIVLNNCTEISCSLSGHILEWNNPDPSCDATMITPTISTPSTTPTSPVTAKNMSVWIEKYKSWRDKLFDSWLPKLRQYVNDNEASASTNHTCSSNSPPSCDSPSCVTDTRDCQYCYCAISSSDCRETLLSAWERDYAFWEQQLEPEWDRIYSDYVEKTET